MGEMEDVVDLNDVKVVQALRKDGLELVIGETQFWQIADEGKKGYSWILNVEDACDGMLDIEFEEGPPMKDDGKGEKKEEKEEKEKEGDEKKEKRLRDGHEEGEKAEVSQIYMSVKGRTEGECPFAMVYAESWDFDEDQPGEDTKAVSFLINVVKAKKEAEAEEKEKEE